jgi:hypothetical protein
VRAAYLDPAEHLGRVTVRFSRPMDPVATASEILLTDYQGEALQTDPVVWPDNTTAQIDLRLPLEPAQPYRLHVGAEAVGTNGFRLDSDGDEQDGEPEDAFSAAFTGSQRIILSRHGAP